MTNKPPDKLSTLLGGEEMTVTLLDGTHVPIRIHQLRIRQIKQFADSIAGTDEVAQIKLFTGKDDDWIDTLSNESALAILKKGHELNSDFFASWGHHQRELADRLLEKMPKLSTSPTTSPSLPSKRVVAA